jgi:drug/metabolite transporter (DMT)-like permease
VSTATLLVWILTCGIWSTVWLFIKIGVHDVPPITFAVFRLGTALVVLVPIVLARRIALPNNSRDWRLIAATGVLLLGVNYALLNWGIQFISSGLTAVLQAMTPVFALLFGHLLRAGERVTPGKTLALAVGVGGVALVFSNQMDIAGPMALKGSAAVVAGAMCVALAYVVMKRHGTHLHPSVITAGQMFSGFLPLVLYASMVEGNPLRTAWTGKAVLAVLYLSFAGSIAGTWLNYWLLKRTSASNLLLMGLVEPLIAVALGAAVLGESMSRHTLLGGIAIMTSVALVLNRPSFNPFRRPSRDSSGSRDVTTARRSSGRPEPGRRADPQRRD